MLPTFFWEIFYRICQLSKLCSFVDKFYGRPVKKVYVQINRQSDPMSSERGGAMRWWDRLERPRQCEGHMARQGWGGMKKGWGSGRSLRSSGQGLEGSRQWGLPNLVSYGNISPTNWSKCIYRVFLPCFQTPARPHGRAYTDTREHPHSCSRARNTYAEHDQDSHFTRTPNRACFVILLFFFSLLVSE